MQTNAQGDVLYVSRVWEGRMGVLDNESTRFPRIKLFLELSFFSKHHEAKTKKKDTKIGIRKFCN
jgi:hypothetical protein